MGDCERKRLAGYVAERLAAFAEVAGAYLYGSVLGEMHAQSDIDVAVVTMPHVHQRLLDLLALEARIQSRLGRWAGRPLHATVLDPDQPLFSFRPIHEGQLVYVGNDQVLTDFIERVARAYADLAPRYRRALREVLEL